MARKTEQPWRVVDVKAVNDWQLDIAFIDGNMKRYDVKPLLEYPLFEALRDEQYFKRACLRNGSVAWDEDLDIAPEELYANGVLLQQAI